MDDLHLIQAVEKYISGSMTPDERVYFEQLRKSNPEVDQLVVEHTFFLQQLNRFDDTKKIKSQLNDIHIDLAEKGLINSTRLQGRAKVAYLYKRYKRVAAIAASIAGITAIAISVLISSVAPGRQSEKDIQQLVGTVEDLKETNNKLVQENRVQSQEIKDVKQAITYSTAVGPKITYKAGGTGFLIDASGYLVTNAHVIAKGTTVAVQDNNGKQYNVNVVYTDPARDLAILKIDDFKSANALPYGIRKKSTDIAEPIFTLGYPRNEIVYGEGYLAAKTGYNGDTLSCQIAIAANPGNSGGPILNHNGEVIGIVNARQTTAEGVVFAIHSKYIYEVVAALKKKDSKLPEIKLPANTSLKSVDRTQQVKRISEFIYRVKVS